MSNSISCPLCQLVDPHPLGLTLTTHPYHCKLYQPHPEGTSLIYAAHHTPYTDVPDLFIRLSL